MMDQCILEDFTQRALSIETLSEATITNSTFTDVGNQAIYLDGDIDFVEFFNNEVSNAFQGVRIFNNPNALVIDQLTAKETTVGLLLVNSSGLLENSTFNDNLFSVYLNNSNGSIITNNTIGYDLYGLTMRDNSTVMVTANKIGVPEDFGKVAIALTNVHQSEIKDNVGILANTYGI